MTPREAVDIYKKNMRKNFEINFLYDSKNYFTFYTEKDAIGTGIRIPSYYVNKNTGGLIDGFKPSPEMLLASTEHHDEGWKDPIPESEYS